MCGWLLSLHFMIKDITWVFSKWNDKIKFQKTYLKLANKIYYLLLQYTIRPVKRFLHTSTMSVTDGHT